MAATLTQRTRAALTFGGASLTPLAVLFGLNLVDEFDRVAFAAVLPEIRNSFGLDDDAVLALGGIVGIVQLLAAIPVGIVADRIKRVHLVVFAAALWGISAALTGVVTALVLLYLVRIGAAIGRISNEVVHPSLLQDYYERDDQPRVFGLHRSANSLGTLAGPVAGLIAAAFFWEAAFWILAIPTAFFLVIAVVRLREPDRGRTMTSEELAEAAEEKASKLTIRESSRTLLAVPSLRRLYVAALLLGVGLLQVGNLLSLFFEKTFGFGPSGRGFIQFVLGLGTITGLVVSARFSGKAQRAGRADQLATITGLSFVLVGLGFFLLAISPVAAVGVAMTFVLAFGTGAYQPAYFSVLGFVVPAKVRSQAYAMALGCVGTGGIAYLIVGGALGASDSYRATMAVLGGVVAAAGALGASARRTIAADAAAAIQDSLPPEPLAFG